MTDKEIIDTNIFHFSRYVREHKIIKLSANRIPTGAWIIEYETNDTSYRVTPNKISTILHALEQEQIYHNFANKIIEAIQK